MAALVLLTTVGDTIVYGRMTDEELARCKVLEDETERILLG